MLRQLRACSSPAELRIQLARRLQAFKIFSEAWGQRAFGGLSSLLILRGLSGTSFARILAVLLRLLSFQSLRALLDTTRRWTDPPLVISGISDRFYFGNDCKCRKCSAMGMRFRGRPLFTRRHIRLSTSWPLSAVGGG